MSTDHSNPADHPLDDRVAAAYTAIVGDLADTLDLTAGAADATHPATYTTLTADLSMALGVDAGLAAIVGSGAPPSLRPTSPTPPHSRLLPQHIGSQTISGRSPIRNA